MRKTMTGLAAFVAVMTVSAMPAMACGNPCASTCGGGGLLTSFTGGGCGGGYGYGGGGYAYGGSYGYATGYGYPSYGSNCCNTGYATLPTQYYYVNQGPTYTGPGAYAPYPAYQERSYSYGYDGGPYANPVNYNYGGGYDGGAQVIRYQPRPRYYHGYRQSYRYAYRPSYGYRPAPRPYYGRPAYHTPRYHAYAPRPQWHHRPVLRRYN